MMTTTKASKIRTRELVVLVCSFPLWNAQTIVAAVAGNDQQSKDGKAVGTNDSINNIRTMRGMKEDYYDYYEYETADDFPSFWETFGLLAPYLFGLLLVIFGLHMLIQSNYLTTQLMNKYMKDGARISGTVIDCEQQQHHHSKKPSKRDKFNSEISSLSIDNSEINDENGNDSKTIKDVSTGTKKNTLLWNTEIVWECTEHQFADNPILKKRHPDAIETRRYAKCFEFEEEQIIGSFVPVLLPQATTTNPCVARSGCPAPVCERILHKELEKAKRPTRIALYGFGLTTIIVLIAMTIRTILINNHSKLAGSVILIAAISIMECGSILYWNIDFQKEKARRFDAARSMVADPTMTAASSSSPVYEYLAPSRDQIE